jgi:predicted amidophosphoribosyltransferase
VFLLPPRCASCGVEGEALCARCRAALVAAGPVDGIDGVRSCRALIEYDGVGRALVAGLKYRNRRTVVAELAELLATAAGVGVHDVVTWVPTTVERRRRRGFDQARLLARATAAVLGRPCVPALVRRSADPQTGRARAARLEGVVLEPITTAMPSVAGVPVLVVDDVVTTGSTLRAAAAALHLAGAASVDAVILGRTPLKIARRVVDDN